MNLDRHLQEFKVVSGGASREYALELSLSTMRSTWETLRVELSPHPFVLIAFYLYETML